MSADLPCHQLEGSTIDEQQRLLVLQKDILESVALNKDHTQQLNQLCLAIEAMLPNTVASIMLFDETGETLYVRAAPSIPDEAIQRLNGLRPGPQAASCGTAVHFGQPVYVENTATDPRWMTQTFQDFALDFNILACWSNPIQIEEYRTLGSFALSSLINRSPNEFEKSLLSICSNLAGIILQRELTEHNLQRLAYYDSLTALANRTLLAQHLEHAVEQAHRHKHMVALLYIDIDNFKMINDSYGHAVGDQVLSSVAKTMSKCLAEGDTLARTGGDEFLLLIENINEAFDISVVAQNIIEQVSALKHPEGIQTTVSIGISFYPTDAKTSQELMRNADTAMYAAKAGGKNNYFFYLPELTDAIQSQITLTHELKKALEQDEFELYFQPIFDAKTRTINSAETLIRWQHPQRGLLTPIRFIQIAEHNGLIQPITEWVLEHTCLKIRNWLNQGYKVNKVSINLSASDIKENFYQKVKETLYLTQCPAQHIEFEITETLLMEQGQSAVDELKHIRALGVSIALDDFGTGYSSLNQLRRLPVDRLKIDRSFIKDIPYQEEDVTLTKIIISMGKSLKMEVVAEGVENEEQAQLLEHEGCDYLQGFLLARPIPENEFLTLLEANANAAV